MKPTEPPAPKIDSQLSFSDLLNEDPLSKPSKEPEFAISWSDDDDEDNGVQNGEPKESSDIDEDKPKPGLLQQTSLGQNNPFIKSMHYLIFLGSLNRLWTNFC